MTERMRVSMTTALLPLLPLLLAAAAPHSALAEGDEPVATPYRLDRDAIPARQEIRLRLDPREPGYTGSVRVDLQVDRETSAIRLHGGELEVSAARLRGPLGADGQDGGEIEAVAKRGEHEQLVLETSRPLAPGAYRLEIDFANQYDTQATSLYRMETDGESYLFTQFEEDDARRAFPCWDEPGFKLPYQITIEAPAGQTVVTNTPVEAERELGDGWRELVFRASRPLPSYLLAIAAGPLESVPVPGMSVPGRVYTVKGRSSLAAEAAHMTPPLLAALEKYFDSRYPFEKLDLIAIPEYWPGAMENPGAITFADGILLLDPAGASLAQRRLLARVLAHEIAHMWFGDVVTMAWWDDLWLNEAFANWMGDKVAHQVFPRYGVAVQSAQRAQNVMIEDARPNAEAIRRPVETTGSLMDNILVVYEKGQTVLENFEQWLGPETFRRGVLRYLGDHRWGNATSANLWNAMHKVSGKDVGAAMSTFTEQPGVPLVSVEPAGGSRVTLRQKRFANFGAELPGDASRWDIPLVLKYADDGGVKTAKVYLRAAEETVELDARGPVRWLMPNAGASGYVRWKVAPAWLAALGDSALPALSPRERVAFVGNLSALLEAGEVPGDAFLGSLAALARDPDPQVVNGVLQQMSRVRLAFVPDEDREPFAAYVRQALRPAVERFGLEPGRDEDEILSLLRPDLLDWLADEGRDVRAIAYAESLASRFLADPVSVDPSLIATVVSISARRGDRALFDTYRQRFEEATLPRDRAVFLGSLGAFENPALERDALAYALAGPLRPQEFFTIPGGIAQRSSARTDAVFAWMMEHYDEVAARVPGPYMGFLPFFAGGCFAGRLALAETFFSQPEHQVESTASQFEEVRDSVRDCIGLREREGERVTAYLRSFAAY